MSDQAWGWILFGCELVGIIGIAIAGRKLWWGWLIVVAGVSIPWMTYSITTQRWGFLALSALWMTANLTNAFRWKYKVTPKNDSKVTLVLPKELVQAMLDGDFYDGKTLDNALLEAIKRQ